MMDWTDRHCRVFHRLLSRRARLYTEMLTTGAVIHGDRQRLLGFHASEHPVALQLGGSNPADLATSAMIGEDFGYDEIDLNVGCPSDRVKDGRFGACLMAEPDLVAEGVAAMKRAVRTSTGSPFSCARLMILSSMSVMLRTYVTASPLARSHRRTTSNATMTRAWPRWQ